MSQRKARWPTRLAKVAAACVTLIALLAVAGKWWLVPALLRWRLAQALPEYWDGSAEIADVDFSFSGPVPLALGGVVLRDRDGRPWFRARFVRLVVSNWPSLHPNVAVAILTRPEVIAHVTAGACRLPLKKVPSEWWDEFVDLKAFSVRDGSVEVVGDGKATFRSGEGDVSLLAGEGGYRIVMSGRGAVATGLRADGFLVADDRVEARRVTGHMCGGRLLMSATGQIAPGGVKASGYVAVKAVDLSRVKLPVRGTEQGLMTAILHFSAGQSVPGGAAGYGSAFVKGANLRNMPAAAEVLRQAGLGNGDVMSDSDIAAQFRMSGTVLTMDSARVQLPLAAIDVEPGGTLDLWTGAMDFVAVAVLFENVRDLLRTIPLVGLVVDLTERLSRFHVKGKWDEPESVAVASAPIESITVTSKRFLTAAARGGGRFGESIVNNIGHWFDRPDPNVPTTHKSQ